MGQWLLNKLWQEPMKSMWWAPDCESICCLLVYQCKRELYLLYSETNLTCDWCFIPFLFQEPCVKNDDRMLGWVCCPSGQLYATARIDRSAYCPGQEVRITGHVSNQSGKQVIGTEVQLIQKALYKAPHGKGGYVVARVKKRHCRIIQWFFIYSGILI